MQEAHISGCEPTNSGFQPCGRRPDAPWFCVWTKPQQEARAEHSLRTFAFPTFFPGHCVTLANRQKRIEPLFRRYGFMQPDQDGQWVGALYAPGVSTIVRDPFGIPCRVPHQAMDRLFAQCSPTGVIYPDDPPEFAENDALRITKGPFAEMVGICKRSAKDRIWLLMEIMGRSTEVGFSRDGLEPA